MKPIVTILLFISLVSCDQRDPKPTQEKSRPRIEFIECNGSPEDVSLQGKTYFNKKVDVVNDTTTISFDFVRDCCLEFVGKWQIDDKILTLSYQPKNEDQLPCECKCAYTMKYHFNNKEYSWYRIKIRKGI